MSLDDLKKMDDEEIIRSYEETEKEILTNKKAMNTEEISFANAVENFSKFKINPEEIMAITKNAKEIL